MNHFDLAQMQEELNGLRAQMEAPGFWEDVEQANKVNKQIRPLEETLAKSRELDELAEELETMIQLAEEE